VAVVAPSGPVDPAGLDAGAAWLRGLGLDVTFGAHVRDRHGFFAGDDAARAADLRDAWCDPEIAAVLCARGGYGAVRVLDHLDWAELAAAPPKLLQGSSDITALHVAFGARLGVATSFGPMVATLLADPDPVTAAATRTALLAPPDGAPPVPSDGASPCGAPPVPFDGALPVPDCGAQPVSSDGAPPIPFDGAPPVRADGVPPVPARGAPPVPADGAPVVPAPVTGGRPLVPGRAAGTLTGGNLSLLASMIGTAYAPPAARGHIVLLEDVGEQPYRVDRMLTQLLMSGWLDGAAGIALGSWTRCGDPDRLRAVLDDRLGGLGVPVAIGLPVGHGTPQHTVMLGAAALLDADSGTLTPADSGDRSEGGPCR
jgi:muramoyltetrapeptide carboxypeptidase